MPSITRLLQFELEFIMFLIVQKKLRNLSKIWQQDKLEFGDCSNEIAAKQERYAA